ncbi:Alpha/Beta hydrolase protein [Gymnopilus junonius]|uniref:Dipeptidyl-peptidase V n=1 Tax=Gymnopilus junonius TaxID=109634 RepID=A0A9P5NQP1_GYMJU|nr:Alpha/Beta hydrolase protein [Gymnopilus junonius]
MVSLGKEFKFKEDADVFTPKDLVELGRPGIAVANDAGDLALVSYSKFSFQDKKNNKSTFVVSLNQSDELAIQIPLDKGGDTFWLSSRTFANVVQKDEDAEIYALDIVSNGETESYASPVLIGTIPSKTAGNFRYNADTGNLVFSAYVYPDGNLSTVAQQDKEWEERGNSAFVYDTTYVRHWDEWQEKKGPQLFSTQIKQGHDGVWALSSSFQSPLQGTKHYSPVEPFGGTDDFDVSATHIIYTTKDPELPEAWHTKQNVYIVPINGTGKPVELTSGKQGATHNPIFNNQGTKVAWLELDEDGYESDRAKIVIYDLEKDVRFTITQHWDRSPAALSFSKDDSFIYLTAGEEAKIKIFALPVPPTPSHSTTHPKLGHKYQKPIAITHNKAVSNIQVLPGHRILFTQSSFASPNDVFIASELKLFEDAVQAEDATASTKIKVDQITKFSGDELKGKGLSDGEEFWFKGALHKDVQGWALKPKGWKAGDKKKWPTVLLIHGGPQGAWEDQWSTRWNPNVFTQQGYFVIMINPTGSTTFGQEFTDAIAEDWGGKPFVDMIHGWKHALKEYPEIDAERAVAAGASWGGYAINWIQGHPEFGFGFKALVCHDGVFDSTYNGYSTDELFFFNHEWGGRPWDAKSKKLSEKYSPANFVHKWSTPQLLIHGSKDYRLPETESIGAFHALQQLGVPSRLVVFPDENHWVLNHGNSLKWHYEVFRWFDQFVGEK